MSTDSISAPGATPDEARRDRRTVLRGAAVVGLAGAAAPLIAACGDDGGTAPATTPSSAPAPPSDVPSSPLPSSAPAGAAVLGPKSEIPVGGGKVYAEAKVVVTQPVAGQFKGFSAVCTHQGCVVRDVTNGSINCACHGSKFAIADGAKQAGPATSPLPPAAITVEGDDVLGPAG